LLSDLQFAVAQAASALMRPQVHPRVHFRKCLIERELIDLSAQQLLISGTIMHVDFNAPRA